MKPFMIVGVALATLGLCSSVVALFTKQATLEEQITTLRAGLEFETNGRKDDIATLAKELEAQSRRLDALQEQTKAMNDRITADDGTIAAHDGRIAAHDGRIATLDHDVKKEIEELGDVRKLAEGQRHALTSLKADVVKGVRSALTQQVVSAAADSVRRGVLQDKTLTKDSEFLKAIGKTLATNFRKELQGVAGTSADNALIATLLKKDSEFLDLVSVTVLMQTPKKPGTPVK